MPTARAAPEASPRRMFMFNTGCLPILSNSRRWPGSVEAWPTRQWSNAPGVVASSTAAAALDTRLVLILANHIGDIDVLLDVVKSVGLSVEDAKAALENRTFEQAVDADCQKSQQYGVTGVPTYVAGGYGVVGAQPYEALEQLMNQIGAERRS